MKTFKENDFLKDLTIGDTLEFKDGTKHLAVQDSCEDDTCGSCSIDEYSIEPCYIKYPNKLCCHEKLFHFIKL